MNTFIKTVVCLLLLAISSPLWAQDYQLFQPKLPAGGPSASDWNYQPLPVPTGQEEVLVKDLKGVIFVSDPMEVSQIPPLTNGIVTNGIDLLKNKDLLEELGRYLNKPMTLDSLNALIRDVILYARRHDRPIVDVLVPEQEITSGVVQIVFLEGKLGKVHAEGNRWFSSSELEGDMRTKPGEVISAKRLLGDVSWINQNPFISTEAVFTPGSKLGFTNVVLETKDRFPARVYGGYEDDGNAATGFDRYETGVNWGDAFNLGLGQQLNYQYTTSGNGDSLRAHAASYIIPLPWHNTLTFFGCYTDTKALIPPLIGITGHSYQISGRYTVPLPKLSSLKLGLNYEESLSVGFDYKYNKNSLEFGGADVPGTLYDVDQFVIGYNSTLTDPYGQTSINDQLYISPGDWGGNNNDLAFDGSHTGATSNYVYNTLMMERLTRLPGDFSLILRGTLQTSNANLAPSEQLGFGGYDTVRGYDEREVNADDGYIFTTELRSPVVSLGEFFHSTKFQDQLQFLGFWDYGDAFNHAPLSGEASETPLSSVGFGVRYSINSYLTVKYDLGFQLLHTNLDQDHGYRSDLGIVISY